MELDRFLPRYDVRAHYQQQVKAPAPRVYQALLAADFSDSLLVRALMSLRTGRLLRRGRPASLRERLRGTGFMELADVPGRELLIGIIGKFWQPSGGRCLDVPAEDFAGFDRPGYAKAAWNFSLEEVSPGVTLLATETRVQCLGPEARRKFRAYWAMVGPFSGLIRRAMLEQVRRAAEGAAPAKGRSA